MYRLLGILLLIVLCACSSPAIGRSSPAVSPLLSTSEDAVSTISPSPSTSLSLSPSLSPPPSLEPSYPAYVASAYPEISLENMQVIAQHEYEDITVTQCHYTIVWEGHRYEGTNISAKKGDSWKNEWEIEYIGAGSGQYDDFWPFVPGSGRIYLLHGLTVSARDVITGEEIWSLMLDGGPRKGAVDSNGILYVTCNDAPLIVAISHKGEILWQHHDVLGHHEAWNFELNEKEIFIRGDDDYGEHLIYFDRDGNYRVEEIRPPTVD